MLRVTPVYGSRWSDEGQATEPQCTLVEYANARLLFNIGWWGYSCQDFPDLPGHDALIITESTVQCAGGLPLYQKQYAETPIFATFPTVKMGQMTMYDQHSAVCVDGKRPSFTLEEVDQAFGHVVGGTFFVLTGVNDDTSIVLTSSYNIAREMHLDPSTLLEHASNADVLVTYPGGPAFRTLRSISHGVRSPLPPLLATQAERNLTDSVLSVLRREGNVLLPVDASGRALELALLLDRLWDRQRLSQTYNLVWVAPMVFNTVEFAKCQLEWMARQLTEQFDSTVGNPFQLRNFCMFASAREFENFNEEKQNPTCVLASGLSLEGGPARDLFVMWASNPDHAVIFTDSSQCYLRRMNGSPDGVQPSIAARPGTNTLEARSSQRNNAGEAGSLGDIASEWTTAAQLLSAWYQAKVEGREMDDSVRVDVNVPVRSQLDGAELVDFLSREESKRREQILQREKVAMLREVEIAKGMLRLGEHEAGIGAAKSVKSAGGINSLVSGGNRPKKKSRFDSSLFMKFSKPQYLVFETKEEAAGVSRDDVIAKFGVGESTGKHGEGLEDDYGIAVVQERFTDIVSGVDPSKFAGGSGRIGHEVLRRGFGYGVDGSSASGRKASSTLPSISRVSDDEDDLHKSDEHTAEAIDLSEGNGIIRGRNGRPPMKVGTMTKTILVLAEISYMPLEGRVDARSGRQSIRALQPRQVVVLGGPKRSSDVAGLVDEVTLLAEAAASCATDGKVLQVPSDGETAMLSVGHAAYSARLIDPPESESAQSSLASCEADLGQCRICVLNAVATGQKVALDGSIVLAQIPAADDGQQHLYVSDGEILLPDLRSDLIASGMKADYSSHVGFAKLVVNGKITIVRYSDSGDIEVEGPLCKDFFAVRSLVRDLFAALW